MTEGGIAVTGASGFIGRHVVNRLLARGIRVRALVRDYGSLPAAWQRDPNFAAVPIFSAPMAGCRALIHLAGIAGVPAENADAALFSANVELTGRLVEAAKASEIRTLIFLSSIRAVAAQTARETIDDSMPPATAEAYGRSKRMAEKLASSFAREGHSAIILRPPLVIGSDAKGNWRRLQRLADSRLWLPFGNIRNHRTYVSVQTLSEAIVHLASRDWPSDLTDAYAVCDPDAISLTATMSALRAGMDRPRRLFNVPPSALRASRLLPGGSADSLFGDLRIDGSRFERVFQFKPAMPILDAIRRSGADYGARHG